MYYPSTVRPLVARIPLAEFTDSDPRLRGARALGWTDTFSFRLAQSSGARMYWATLATTSQILVFAWDEGSRSITSHAVNVSSWDESDLSVDLPPFPDQPERKVVWDHSPHPPNRILGATAANGCLWFAWPAGRDLATSSHLTRHPQPYVQIAVVDAQTFALTDQKYIWNPDYAFIVPALASNSAGDVGVSLGWGSATQNINPAVGLLDGSRTVYTTAHSGWDNLYFGHYVSVHRDYSAPDRFVATGTAAQPYAGDSHNMASEPHYVVFGKGT
jgi:hypothetical protein